MRTVFSALALLMLAVLLLPASTPQPAAAQDGETAPYEIVDCPVTMPIDAVECGFVTVPRDRDNPDEGTIRIATMIMRSTNPTPLADPVVYLDGGPGGFTIETAPFTFDTIYSGFLAQRDVVIFDQRGIGFSEPSLNCDALRAFDYEVLGTAFTTDELRARTLATVNECARDLAAQTDLSDFNSTENGADVPDILRALGYEEWNLYGISYGTMLAQYVLRDNPEGTRSVILDANVPLTVDLFETIPASFRRSLDEMIAACEAQAACNAAYPDLPGTIDRAYATLEAEPVLLTVPDVLRGGEYPVIVDGDEMMNILFQALYAPIFMEALPRMIHELAQRDGTTMRTIQIQFIAQLPWSNTMMYLSIMCTDEIPFNALNEIETAYADPALGTTLLRYFESDVPLAPEFCTQLPPLESTPASNVAIQSDVPALIVGGQFDPITPPAFSDILAESFSTAYVYEYPASGHGATTDTDCASSMMQAFLDNPTTAPDDSCIAQIPPFAFQVPTEEFAIQPVSFDAAQLTFGVLDGWEEIETGLYSRDGGSTTLLLVQRLPLPTDSALASFGSLFEGGVLPPLAEVIEGTHYDWNVYEGNIQGSDGVMAVAEDNGQTLIVILVPPASEQESFFEQYLVPALIDAAPLP